MKYCHCIITPGQRLIDILGYSLRRHAFLDVGCISYNLTSPHTLSHDLTRSGTQNKGLKKYLTCNFDYQLGSVIWPSRHVFNLRRKCYGLTQLTDRSTHLAHGQHPVNYFTKYHVLPVEKITRRCCNEELRIKARHVCIRDGRTMCLDTHLTSIRVWTRVCLNVEYNKTKLKTSVAK